VEYTFENANLVGIGVFDNDTDNLVQFRGIVSNSASLTVTLNATDNTIEFDFDDEALIIDIPDATTAQRGILETATDAEAIAKAATNKTLTPSNLAALDASTSFQGLVELATDAETIAGISTTLAVTPAGLAAVGATNTLTTWADAVTRAGADPSYDGQIGVQRDTNVPWVANGAAVGDFDVPLVIQGANPLTVAMSIDTTGFTFTFDGSGQVSCEAPFSASGNTSFIGPQTQIGNSSGEFLNFASPTMQIEGVTFVDGLLGSDNTGLAVKYDIDGFISINNQQSGWGVPSGTLARTTFATYAGQTISNPPTQAEVQAIDDALLIVSRRLGALITDIMARLLPVT
jgi:hypothetical protein